MDEEELAKSLIDAAKSSIRDEEVNTPATPTLCEDADDLDRLIHDEAKRIQAEFRITTDAADRHRLHKRYSRLDSWMAVLKAIDTMEPVDRAVLKQSLWDRAQETVSRWRREQDGRRRQQIESDAQRKHRREGHADSAATRRMRDEIELLLRNYTRANDYKIQSLLDKWRRSGDPSFDPSIATRLQMARKRRDHPG